MALQYGFFDAVENSGAYDREYSAGFFSALMKATYKNGIMADSFIASVGTGLSVNLTAGNGFVNGVFFYDDAASTVTCTSASGTRTDLIVARLNTAARTVSLEVKAGTATVADNEVAIASVTVNGSAVTSVSNYARTNCLDTGLTVPNISYGTAAPSGGSSGDIYFKIVE